MFFILLAIFLQINGECVDRSQLESVYCSSIVYPVYVERDPIILEVTRSLINGWISYVKKHYYSPSILNWSLSSIECTISFPTCFNGIPQKPCISDCRNMFKDYLSAPCDTNLFFDDSKNKSNGCTRIPLSSSSSVSNFITSSLFLLLSLLLTVATIFC